MRKHPIFKVGEVCASAYKVDVKVLRQDQINKDIPQMSRYTVQRVDNREITENYPGYQLQKKVSNQESDTQEPVAWARKWHIDGEVPAKVNGRWPAKFKLLPITPHKCLHDDVPLVALTVQLAEARRDAEIGAAIEKAARDLPEYYELEITVERGAASVYLRNPDGETSCIDKDSDNQMKNRKGKKAFYVLITSHAVYTKTAEFFKSQGGHSQKWGKYWRKIFALNLDDARQRAKDIGVKEKTFSAFKAREMI